MASEAPPTYEQTMGQLNQVQAPEQLQVVARAIVEHCRSTETSNSLLDKVNSVVDSAPKLDQFFVQVRADLGKLEYEETNYKDLWDAHHKDYLNLRKASGEAATKAVDYLDEYIEFVLPVVKAIEGPKDISGREKAIRLLNKLLNDAPDVRGDVNRETTRMVEPLSGDFQRLRLHIGGFTEEFAHFADRRAIALTKQITLATNTIIELRQELNEISSRITSIAVPLGTSSVGNATAERFDYTPSGIFEIAKATISAIAHTNEATGSGEILQRHAEKQKELEHEQIQLDGLQSRKETLTRVKTCLFAQQEEILTTCQRINEFGCIRLTVVADAEELQKLLSPELTIDPEDILKLQTHLSASERIYVALRESLLAYIKH